MNLILDYEASALAAPQSFRDAMQTAANILDSTILDNITVTIQVGYGDYFNGQISGLGTSAVGGDLYGGLVSYTNLKAALASHETSTLDQTFVNSLPTGSSVNGVSSMYVPSAIEKALGMISPTASAIDGAVGIGTSIPTADLVGVALHEFTHALGREPGAGTFDLGRYTSTGTHLFSSGSTAPAAYFSIDGGVTKLADYGQNSDPSDFLNSGVQGSTDPFNEFYSGATSQVLSTVDIQLLDSLGFNTTGGVITSAPTVGPSAATSSIVSSSSTVTADGSSTTTLTVTVEDASGHAVAGTAVTLSASGSSNIFGAISGTTDANGVFKTTLASTVAQNETITATEGGVQEQTSVSFVAPAIAKTVIESFGSTSLVEVGNNFYLNSTSGATGPELKYANKAVVAGQFGAWTPIGAEKISNGYEVAWKEPGSVAGTYQYEIWTTKNNGNETSNTGALSGTSTKLESFETSFHQDLNGDGVIGIPAATAPVASNNGDAMFSVGRGGAIMFAPNSGQAATPNFALSADPIQLSEANSEFTTALLAATHSHDNFVFAFHSHDMLAMQDITAARSVGHQSDFHI